MEINEIVKIATELGYETEIMDVTKTNTAKKGVMVMMNNKINPVFYPDGALTESDIRKGIQSAEKMNEHSVTDPDNVVLSKYVINYEKNKELLKTIPHEKICDLALITRGFIKETHTLNDATASFIVPDTDTFKDCEYLDYHNLNMPPFLTVVSNAKQHYGSGAIGDIEFLKNHFNKINNKFWIFPSSIHELIIMPYDDTVDVNALKDMVCEINKTQVAKNDWLSDNVYLFDGNKVTIVK